MRTHQGNKTLNPLYLLINLLVLTSLACQFSSTKVSAQAYPTDTPAPLQFQTSATPEEVIPVAEIYFWVQVPEPIAADEQLQLIVFDEVSGLPFNQTQMIMQSLDGHTYAVALRARVGSVIKYRYQRAEQQYITNEHQADGRPVHYRLYYVDGPGETHDLIAGWADTPKEQRPTAAETGRITGFARAADSGAPIPNLLISAGGQRSISAADGSFILNGLLPGQHMLTAYALDGSFYPFKQNAIVMADAATPVIAILPATHSIPVTLTVSLPEGSIPAAPLRLAGSLRQLGNTFNDLGGGVSGLPAVMPQLRPLDSTHYQITLTLPTGIPIEYKYTLGDGFWNAEFNLNGGLNTRQIVIPTGVDSYQITDQIINWQPERVSPIWFDVTAPPNTPASEQVYIQFQLLGWMSPVPMWPLGDNRWVFQLLNPPHSQEGLVYRYCRSADCRGDASQAAEQNLEPRRAITGAAQVLTNQDQISAWRGLSPAQEPAAVLFEPIQPRAADFVAGIALAAEHHPAWQAHTAATIKQVKAAAANTVILSPTWQVTKKFPPQFTQTPGQDMLWHELAASIRQAQAQKLTVLLFPQFSSPLPSSEWWQQPPDQSGWWNVWFEQYRRFILHHAVLAAHTQADGLILGGEWVMPALTSPLPKNQIKRWQAILDEARTIYDGQLIWSIPHSALDDFPRELLTASDAIHVQWGISLANWPEATLNDIRQRAEVLLDTEIYDLHAATGLPVVISLAYPSANGGLTNCLPTSPEDAACLPLTRLSPASQSPAHLTLDLREQVEIFNAIFATINQREWVGGVIAAGYYPPFGLEDFSPSIHGKPAEAVVRYWFSDFLGDE